MNSLLNTSLGLLCGTIAWPAGLITQEIPEQGPDGWGVAGYAIAALYSTWHDPFAEVAEGGGLQTGIGVLTPGDRWYVGASMRHAAHGASPDGIGFTAVGVEARWYDQPRRILGVRGTRYGSGIRVAYLRATGARLLDPQDGLEASTGFDLTVRVVSKIGMAFGGELVLQMFNDSFGLVFGTRLGLSYGFH